MLLYAWCRHCDDVIDGQELGHGQRAGGQGGDDVLAALEAATRRACTGEAIDDPVFAGLQHVVQQHGIPRALPAGAAGGLSHGRRRRALRDASRTRCVYCYHVAGVVGVMMAMVMGARRPATLDRACDLGLAFQLTNIARDVVEDAAIGRVYLPARWLREAGLDPDDDLADPRHREALGAVAARLVDLAEPYYASAAAGIGALPLRSAWAVATARGVYRDIGRKVKAHGAHAWDTRISTTRMNKLWLIARGAAVAIAVHGTTPQARPPGLWRRPD